MTWKTGFYVQDPEPGPWELHMVLQGHEPTNAVFLNGHFLGYLPMKDWVYSWVSAKFYVPCHLLRPGYNELIVKTGTIAPQLQGQGFTWDDLLFRGIFLERAAPESPTADVQDCEKMEE